MGLELLERVAKIGWRLYESELSRLNDNSCPLQALQDLLPAAEHMYCVRYIHDNMNLVYEGGHYKELMWKCVTATTVVAFEIAMDEFKWCNRMAHEWLRKIPPKHEHISLF
nr:hypothetical protein [Tanacetum cinerariifolium]